MARSRLPRLRSDALTLAFVFAVSALVTAPAIGEEWLYANEGNRMIRLPLDGAAPPETLIERAPLSGETSDDPNRRDVNGMICPFPDGSGRFVAGEDTGQPATPPGWGVFDASGRQRGKLTPTYFVPLGEPFGCAFDGHGRLFTTDVGNKGFGTSLGQLIVWFPPFEHYPGAPDAYPNTAVSDNFCKIASDIGTAGAVAIDARGRVYVASASRGRVLRYTPPFPTAPTAEGGCGGRDALGSPTADTVDVEVFAWGLYTFSGLAFGPRGSLYASSVATGEIVELDAEGGVARSVLEPRGWLPPFETGTPQGIAFDAAGNLYYADLDLQWAFPSLGPGANGTLRRVRISAESVSEPEVIVDGLRFPDGVAVVHRDPGDR